MDRSTLVEKIIDFLVNLPGCENRSGMSDKTEIADSDLIDSLSVMQLMLHLSEDVGVEIDADDFVEENFENVGTVANLILSKMAA